MRRHRQLLTLNKLLEEDMKNLKETDFMGPTTRAEWNYRKRLTESAATSGGQQYFRQNKPTFDFSSFDEILQRKKSDQLKIAKSLFGRSN